MTAVPSGLSARGKAFLQLCRLGKAEHYGRQLALITIYHPDGPDVVPEGVWEIADELEVYNEIAMQYQVRTALERWRLRGDEVDAETVFDNCGYLRVDISLAELHAIWYDCSAKKARDMLERITRHTSDLKGEEIDEILHQLRLLTLDIPTETRRPFPYNRVLLAWPGGSNEKAFLSYIKDGIRNLAESYRSGSHESVARLAPYEGRLYEEVLRNISHRASQWGWSLEGVGISHEDVAAIAREAEAAHKSRT